MAERIRIEMYSRPGCHLCDDARAVVEQAARRHPVDFKVIDIEGNPALESEYGAKIPVVRINGKTCFVYRVEPEALLGHLERLWNP